LPNRILREGILTSERIAMLNWPEEVFYRRLMSVVDDFGRYHANPKLLRAACYPLLIDKVSDADVGKWLTSCVTAALVSVYPAPDGKRYLQMLDFRQQARAEKSKFPQMQDNCVADAQQVHSTSTAPAPVFVFGDAVVVDKPAAPVGAVLFAAFWQAYPKKKAKDDALKAFQKRKPDQALLDAMLRAITAQRGTEDWQKEGGKFIPYPATWLNDGRWQDETVGDVETAAVKNWWDSGAGVRRHGQELGLPDWSETEQFSTYRARVFAKAGPGPWNEKPAGLPGVLKPIAAPEPEGQPQ
jgi:hypothetical protein